MTALRTPPERHVVHLGHLPLREVARAGPCLGLVAHDGAHEPEQRTLRREDLHNPRPAPYIEFGALLYVVGAQSLPVRGRKVQVREHVGLRPPRTPSPLSGSTPPASRTPRGTWPRQWRRPWPCLVKPDFRFGAATIILARGWRKWIHVQHRVQQGHPSACLLAVDASDGRRCGLPFGPIRSTYLSALPHRKSHRYGRRLRSSDHLLSSLWRYKVLCHHILTKTVDYLERPNYHHSRHRRRHGI